MKSFVRTILIISLLIFGFESVFSQTKNTEQIELKPYVGLSAPAGNFNDFSESGSVLGLSVDKYIGPNFALGFDINLQSNSFTNPFDFSAITSPNSILNSTNGNWSATSFSFGPTYRIGSSKFNAEIYSKFGLLYIKSAEAKSVYQYNGGTKDIFSLPEQKRTGFGVTSGIRLNYQISKQLSLFLNPQYVFGAAKIDYCNCGLDTLDNPDLILEQEPIKESISPSYLNVNAGLTFNIGGNEKATNENGSSTNRNLPDCLVTLHAPVTCSTSGPMVTIKSDWWGQNVNSTLSIKIYDGTTIVYSNNTITNNNQLLNQATDSRNHNFVAFGYEGRTLTALITIEDQNGVVSCNKSDLTISIPDCQYAISCGWDYNVTCDYNSNAIKIDVSSVWSNVPIGSSLKFILTDLVPPGLAIPFTSNPSNLPLAINGSGTANHELFINGNQGANVVFKMQIIDANGTVLCSQGIDMKLPRCEFITCEPSLISAECINEQPTVAFQIDWANYPTFGIYSIYVDVVDATGTPLSSINIPPRPLTGPAGVETYTMNLLSQYAGTTISVLTRICENGGIKKCCVKKLIIDVPECCEVCSDLNIVDTTNRNQNNSQTFRIMGNINPVGSSSPIKKVVAQLESIGFEDKVSPGLSAPNHEFFDGRFFNTNGATQVNIIGSLTGGRSNMVVADINASTATNTTFILHIDNYLQKRVMSYRIKLTIFKNDGTYCERILEYTR